MGYDNNNDIYIIDGIYHTLSYIMMDGIYHTLSYIIVILMGYDNNNDNHNNTTNDNKHINNNDNNNDNSRYTVSGQRTGEQKSTRQ